MQYNIIYNLYNYKKQVPELNKRQNNMCYRSGEGTH